MLHAHCFKREKENVCFSFAEYQSLACRELTLSELNDDRKVLGPISSAESFKFKCKRSGIPWSEKDALVTMKTNNIRGDLQMYQHNLFHGSQGACSAYVTFRINFQHMMKYALDTLTVKVVYIVKTKNVWGDLTDTLAKVYSLPIIIFSYDGHTIRCDLTDVLAKTLMLAQVSDSVLKIKLYVFRIFQFCKNNNCDKK